MPMRLEWHGDEALEEIVGATMDGLELAAEHLVQVSSSRAPHEEGSLERSGDTDKDEDDLKVSVFFDEPYAVVQHEELTWRHDAGREAKYLENAMNEERETMLAIIAEAASEPLEG